MLWNDKRLFVFMRKKYIYIRILLKKNTLFRDFLDKIIPKNYGQDYTFLTDHTRRSNNSFKNNTIYVTAIHFCIDKLRELGHFIYTKDHFMF